ncbi:MAG: hypothetical protein ACU0A6_03835 [Shimia sp.]|uniref:hypothetical protein n=1 Tax=Shimia sp. TaxID=1954381 RepID=UPI004059641C
MTLLALMVPVVFGTILFLAFSGGPVVFPDWARERIERALDQQLTAMDVVLGDVSLVIEENWDPRLRITGLELLPEEGGSGIRFESVDMRLAGSPLLDRQFAPREVRASGVSLRILRRKDGSVNVTLGQGEAGQGGAGAFGADAAYATLGDQIEALMERPALRHLQRFEIEEVSLRYEDARKGRGWNVDGGSITLNRTEEVISIAAQMALLGGRSYATTFEASLSRSVITDAVQIAINFEDAPSEDLATQVAALSWLEVLRAPISGAMRAEIDGSGTLGAVNATLSAGAGSLQPNDTVRAIPFESLRSYLTYDPKSKRIGFDELSVTADWIQASVSGHALLRDFQDGLPNALLAQLTLNGLEAKPEVLDAAPIVLDTSYVDFRLQLNPFDLELGQMVINQDGVQMYFQGDLEAKEDGWKYALDGRMNAVEPAQILAIWPEQFKPKLRIWIDENIFAAKLRDINLALRSRVDQPPEVYADFQFSDAIVKPVKTLPPVQGGRGFAVMLDNQFRVGVENGYVTPDQGGTVDVSGSSFVVENTRLKQSPGRAQVRATGSIEAAASLLNRPPLQLFDKSNLPVDVAQGRMEAEGELTFVMKPKLLPHEVNFDVTGRLGMVKSTKLVPGKLLRGDMRLNATNAEVEIFGPGSVGDVPVTARWHTVLGKPGEGGSGESTVVGQVALSAAAVEEFNVGLPSGTIGGSGPADFVVDFKQDQAPKLRLTSDLKGVRILAQPIGWSKPAAQTGEFELAMTLGARPSVDRITLNAPGLSAEGTVSLLEGGALGTVDLPTFSVGSWLSGAVRLTGRGGTAMPAVELRGGRFDLREMPDFGGSAGSSAGGRNEGGPISGTLSEVVIADNIVVTNASLDLSTKGALNGSFDGLLGGRAPITGKLSPHANGTAISVSSANAGAVVQAMGLVKKATNGTLALRLVPRKTPTVYDGFLNIKNIKLQDLPAFAELLNAVSIVGLLEQLNGPGLLFNEVHSVFKMAPGEIVIGEASAVGASMGISADGRFLTKQGLFDIQGVLSPIYAVNVIGRPISKRGEGLIGFNYQLKGPAKNPEIFVNPLSALTPGFFREIFRRPPPDLSK